MRYSDLADLSSNAGHWTCLVAGLTGSSDAMVTSFEEEQLKASYTGGE
jgi:hypothetical protein